MYAFQGGEPHHCSMCGSTDGPTLKSEDVRQQFSLELSNRQSVQFTGRKGIYRVDEEWQILEDTVMDTAQQVIGFRQGTRKEQ